MNKILKVLKRLEDNDYNSENSRILDIEYIRQNVDGKKDSVAILPIKSLTLGSKLEGKITEQEAVDLVNTVLNSFFDVQYEGYDYINLHRTIVDLTWNECTQSEAVPSTKMADEIIIKAIGEVDHG